MINKERELFETAYCEVYKHRGDKNNREYYLRRNSLNTDKYYEVDAIKGWALWQARANLIPDWQPTDSQVSAWNARNDDAFHGKFDNARVAIDDARSLHLLV